MQSCSLLNPSATLTIFCFIKYPIEIYGLCSRLPISHVTKTESNPSYQNFLEFIGLNGRVETSVKA